MKSARKKLRIFVPGIVIASFIFLQLTPAVAGSHITSFGNGKVQVRLYSDYFCPACRRLEPKIERMIMDLVKRNAITLTLIDTPIHKYSTLYTRYFLYALNSKSDFKYALDSRKVLFNAAKEKIEDSAKLEGFLNTHGIAFRKFDVRPVFEAMSAYLRADKVDTTPTLVIESDDKKETYQGNSILPAIEELLTRPVVHKNDR
jgi:protein-disulfide isomerase